MVTDTGMDIGKVWENLPEPSESHPEETLLWDAEKTLQSINELAERPDIKHAFAKRLEEYISQIGDAAQPVLATEHSIAFVGNIGVGKSTVMCRIAELEIAGEVPATADPVLETGAGGTTLCEVALVQGSDYGLAIEPKSDEEIRREVREFSRYLKFMPGDAQEENTEDPDFPGTSKEIARAIRNMSGLANNNRERGPDGRFLDLAKGLAGEISDADSLATEILNRMDLQARTALEITYSGESEDEPLLWLKNTFRKVNSGMHPDLSLPNRIEIRVPQRILGQESLSICLVDTKGIDDTAEREDLESHFQDPNTVVILCSAFNDAPAPSAQQLLERAIEGGFPDLDAKAAILVLPRPDEALAVKFDDGFPVTDAAEGYDLKKDQATTRLESRNLPVAGIEFFNVRENDDPSVLNTFLEGLVNGLRKRHSARLDEAIRGATATVQNYEEEQESEILREAARHLSIWLQNNEQIGVPSRRLQDSLLEAIQTVNASSLRASVNRYGVWRNLNYPYQLGSGARSVASRAVSAKRQGFKAITDNLLQDPDLEDAHDLVRQARSIIESGVNQLLDVVRSVGIAIHDREMKPDTQLWAGCISEWGQGPGYRGRVHDRNSAWFDNPNRDSAQAEMLEFIECQWRQILERVSAILPTD